MLTAVEPSDFPWGDYRRYTFSLGLRTADDLILSGQTAATFDAKSRRSTLPRGIGPQTEVVYDKIIAVLSEAGFEGPDVVRVVTYVTAPAVSDLRAIDAVRRSRLPDADAATRTIFVDRLLRDEAHIEIAVAARRRSAEASGEHPLDLPSIVPKQTRDQPLAAQVDEVLELAERQLDAIGAKWADVLFALEHVVAHADALPSGTVLDRSDRIGSATMAGARVGTRRLVEDGHLVQLDLTVARSPVEVIEPDADFLGPSTLAAAVRGPGRIYLSAQQGEPSAESVDVRSQADVAYGRLLGVLERAGGNEGDLLETVEHVTHKGLPGYSATAAVRRNLLPQPYTAATGTVCSAVEGPGCFTIYGTAIAD